MIEWHSSPGSASPDDAAQSRRRLECATCPNCHREAERQLILSAPVDTARVRLYACQACGAHYFEGPMAGAYSGLPAGGTDALAFYLQQGANIGGMAMRLQALGRPPGTAFLEVGCGFGLSLDFARRILGWQVRGLDPSPFAIAGREQLGLPIESRYLEANGLDHASADVIHASEFIEHMADPVPMLATLRQALRPGGTLLLTTPAAEMIRPDTGDGLLVPLLSAGWHLVIQTAESLAWALREAGFETVSVLREGAQLVAMAGRLPDAALPDAAFRPQYHEWLRQVAQAVPAQSDLGFGALARLYRELVIAGLAEADALWQALDGAAAGRWGHGLERLAATPVAGLSLSALVAREPLGLAGILLARGWERKRAGEAPQGVFAGAIAAAGRLRAALRGVGADDGDAEDVAFAAEAELILLAVARAEPGIAARLEALRKAGGQRHADNIAPTCFITLVNQAAFEQAQRLNSVLPSALSNLRAASQPLTSTDASVLFCAATMEMQTHGGQPGLAIAWLGQLRGRILASHCACGADDMAAGAALYWPAVDAEMLGWRLLGQHKAAAYLAAEAEHAAREARFPARAAA
ncbi:class I SAM-dependent methyltransferase [Rhodovarius sp.]|uniref:class I SAM-dependent methyltransferase n=1 Tax=Rhodovarius sp. TaxID=2972673 RepID=UPI0033402844